MPELDVMKDLKKNSKTSQSVPEEQGNNAGPGTTSETSKGDIKIKGTPDYMGAGPDMAGK